jgi:hypothetical protein
MRIALLLCLFTVPPVPAMTAENGLSLMRLPTSHDFTISDQEIRGE